VTASQAVVALVHGLWISGLSTAAAGFAVATWGRFDAARRCRVWLAALALCLTAPAATILLAWRSLPERQSPVARVEPRAEELPAPPAAAGLEPGPDEAEAVFATAPPDPGPPHGRLTLAEGPWAGWALSLAAAVALLGVVRLGLRLYRLTVVKRNAAPVPESAIPWRDWLGAAGVRRRVDLRASARVDAPVLVGYRRPAVLVSLELLEQLSRDERRQILLHELVHLDRYDDWILVFQRIVEAVLWFHPAVHWIGRRLDFDREVACDEVVARRAGGRRRYVGALLHLAEVLRDRREPALAPALLSARGKLSRRIELLLGAGRRPALPARRLGFGAVAFGLVALAGTGNPVRIGPAGAIAAPSRLATADRRAALGAALDRELRRFADSGFSGTVLVAVGGEVVLEQGYGLADRERRIAATADTRYALAGFTKSFTAAAVLRLAERGLLSLTDPVGRYVPELTGPKAGATIHQLLTHTDGMTRLAAPIFRADRAAFLHALDRTPVAFPPGAGQRYNDFGHSLLAIVVERITGTTFEQHIREQLLAPLGLNIQFESDRGEMAMEYAGRPDHQVPIPARGYVWGRRGSLGMVGTARDAYRWLRAVQDSSVGSVISPAVRRRMLEPRFRTEWGALQTYGWDWSQRPDGGRLLHRVAGTPGFEGEILHHPAGRWSAVILVNSRVGWRFRIWRGIERLVGD